MRRPHGGHVLGASPQSPFTDDLTARQGYLICPQDQLLDLRMVQSWYQSGALKGGLWLPDWAYQEQSAGTAVTAAGQVVGVWAPAASSYSASQTTTANKPLTAITPVTRKPWLTADSTDVLPVVFPTSLGSACTIARATPTGVTFDENQTISTTWNNLIRPYQYNSAVLVADRQLTAREKAIVSRVLGAYVPALSNELISNGQFDADLSGWALGNVTGGATIVWEAGRAHVVSPLGVGWTALRETILRAGGYYLVKATLEISSGVVCFNMGSSDPQVGSRTMTTSGSYSTVLGRAGTDNYFYLTKCGSSPLLDCYWDNASVREVV